MDVLIHYQWLYMILWWFYRPCKFSKSSSVDHCQRLLLQSRCVVAYVYINITFLSNRILFFSLMLFRIIIVNDNNLSVPVLRYRFKLVIVTWWKISGQLLISNIDNMCLSINLPCWNYCQFILFFFQQKKAQTQVFNSTYKERYCIDRVFLSSPSEIT